MIIWKKQVLGLLLLCGSVMAGCGGVTPGASVSSTATATLPPTATLPADAQCLSKTDTSVQQFFTIKNIVVPAKAVLTGGLFGGANAGPDGSRQYSVTYQLFNVCVPLATPAEITQLYQATMPANGWNMSSTFPYLTDLTAPCKTFC